MTPAGPGNLAFALPGGFTAGEQVGGELNL